MAETQKTGMIELGNPPTAPILHFAPYISSEPIEERTNELAEQILTDYDGRPLHIIHVALGGVFWAVDLSRALCRQAGNDLKITHDMMRVRSYGQGTTSSGVLEPLGGLGSPNLVEDSHVLLVDEVYDSGLTLLDQKRRMHNGVPNGRGSDTKTVYPASVAIAVLTSKIRKRTNGEILNYVAFETPDVFLVGMGMDYAEEGREREAIYRSVMPDNPSDVPPYTIPPTFSPFGFRTAG